MTTAAAAAATHQPLAPLEPCGGTGLRRRAREHDGSPDETQEHRSPSQPSGRHRRHLAPIQHQTFSSLRLSFTDSSPPAPPLPLSTSAPAPAAGVALAGPSSTARRSELASATSSTGQHTWSSNVRADLGSPQLRPSLLTSPRQRYRSFNKHAPSYKATHSKISHSRSHSLSAPAPHSLLPDDSAPLTPSEVFPRPAPHSSPQAPRTSRRSFSVRPAPSPLPPVDLYQADKFLPLPPGPSPSPDPAPAPSLLRSFRTFIPYPLSSVNPFRGLTGSSGILDEIEDPPSPQPIVTKMVSGAREAALGTALREGADPTPTLEEYAWRSLIARIRVRDYCEGATFAVCASSVNHARRAITHTPTRLLFPYDLATDAPSGAHTPPLLSPSTLSTITRKQVVDVILRLVRERAPIEARVLEIMLEYIGKKWQASEGDVEGVAKKLSEIVSDVEANEPNKCSAAISMIQRLRFQLGLVSSSQLASRLNSLPAFLRSSSSGGVDASQLIHAWAVRRLNASQSPQSVAEALCSLRDSLNHAPHREAVGSVLRSFGLDGRRLSGKESPSRNRNRITARSFQTSPRISPSKRRTMPFPHWLPRHSTRFNNGEERRPSLPTLPAPTENISWPIMQGQEGPPRTSPDGSPCHTPTPTAGGSPACGSQLRLLDPSSVRIAVVDQILELRYRLGPDADGWFLGTGQEKAVEMVNHFPGSEELRDTIADLRRIFQLPDPAVSNKLGLTIVPLSHKVDPLERPKIGFHVTTPSLDAAPIIHERDVSFDLDQYMADITDDDASASSATMKPDDEEHPKTEVVVATEGDTGPSMESPGLLAGPVAGPETRSSVSSDVSHYSFTSGSSALSSGGRRGSTISDYVICEAVRVTVDHGSPFQATQDPVTIDGSSIKTLIRHSKSLSMLSDHDMYTRLPEPRSRRSPQRHHTAMPSLSAPICKADFDLEPADEAGPDDARLSGSVPLMAPTPKASPSGVDFSISPVISPLPSPIATARPSKEFHTVVSGSPSPPMMPESSPSARARSYQRLSASPIDRAASRTPTVSSPDGRSRRHRQMVIVDGEPISPGSTRTPLGMVLTLFSKRKDLTPDAVEQILSHAVQVEEERLSGQDEAFDAEARVRLAWLLEQVANELSQPELIAAVQRVLSRLSNREIPVPSPSSSNSYSPLSSSSSATSLLAVAGEATEDPRRHGSQLSPTSHTHQQRATVPPSSFGSRMYGRRDLTIKVPPRGRSSILLTSSPSSSPTAEGSHSDILKSSPEITSDSSGSLYSSSSLYSTTMSTAVSMGFTATPSSEESFSTSPAPFRRPNSKPPMIRFPNYTRTMRTPIKQHQRSGPTYTATISGQRLSLGSSPNSSPLAPLTPEQTSGSFESPESTKGIRRSPLGPQPPKLSPPIPLADVHAL